jgi:hypothetical protein
MEFEAMQKYMGKEVVSIDGTHAHISSITGFAIDIDTSTKSGCNRFMTGTGPNSNAVARGSLKFVDEELNKSFIAEYEEYRKSYDGSLEAFIYYSNLD